MTTPVKGPESSFPSIKKRYGQPVLYWLELIAASPLDKHGQLATWLKSEHGLGHGSALVAHALEQR